MLQERWGEQRAMRKGHVSVLVSDMNAGRFRLSPDAIVLIGGKLANGQHRLQAVAESGKAQQFLVMETNDPELYKVIDAGLKRSAGDALIGNMFSKVMPSIARWVIAYDVRLARASAIAPSHAAKINGVARSQSEIIDFCLLNKEALVQAASFVNPLYEETKLLPLSIGGALFFLASRQGKPQDKVEQFLKAIYIDGGQSAAGDLRNRLIANRGAKAKLKSGYLFGLCVKSARSFFNGTRPGVLKWSEDEEMPVLD